MEKKTLEDFLNTVAEKYKWPNFDSDNLPNHIDMIREACELHTQHYVELAKSDQHKIAVDMALEYASRVIDGWPENIMTIEEQQEKILKGKTDKSLQYENR